MPQKPIRLTMQRLPKGDDKTVSGYILRAVSNGRLGFGDVCRQACENTTMHPAEMQLAASLFVEGVCEAVANGYIVELPGLGTFSLKAQSQWLADPNDFSVEAVSKTIHFRPSRDSKATIAKARLVIENKEESK